MRAASVTCFAGMTSSVFISFTKEKQDFILSSLVSIIHNLPNAVACSIIAS